MNTKTFVLSALFAAGTAFAGEPLPYNRFDLGVGNYGSNYRWGNGTELDIAREDWCVVGIGNESADMETVNRVNRYIELNPKFKIILRTWPRCTYRRATDPKDAAPRTVWAMDYHYYPEARKSFLDVLLPESRGQTPVEAMFMRFRGSLAKGTAFRRQVVEEEDR